MSPESKLAVMETSDHALLSEVFGVAVNPFASKHVIAGSLVSPGNAFRSLWIGFEQGG